ncbi:hypothetical protein EYF80_012312 [Liparis tanakae]|uniref:Uncharacterized protein n=1 Tax=Liparis tanakae TaxID=230148 RepID=A0A4Z2II19_9TELE|nr:hypothetical protein EYF80_012312 [Liparis tanakae]
MERTGASRPAGLRAAQWGTPDSPANGAGSISHLWKQILDLLVVNWMEAFDHNVNCCGKLARWQLQMARDVLFNVSVRGWDANRLEFGNSFVAILEYGRCRVSTNEQKMPYFECGGVT